MKKLPILLTIFLVLGLLASTLVVVHSSSAASLEEAISKTPVGTEKGQISPDAPKGYLGIPGAPSLNLIVGLFWAIWVGWIFSSVGAFGGIMAGVGHLTVFGLGDYAKTFKNTSPALNKLITDSIRVSNQWLVGLSAAISSMNYYRMGRLVAPLGIALAVGSVGGSILVPVLTAGKIKLSAYQGYFGLAVFIIGAFLFYETTPRGQNRKKEAKAAAQAFEKSIKEKKTAAELTAMGVKVTNFGLTSVSFTFFGVEFNFNPIIAAIGGLFIAALASFLGIGGGFLFVPFLTSVVGLPMYLVAGTSALTVFVGMVVSIFSYMVLKATMVQWSLIGMELIGIFIGSMIGPRTSKYIPDIWLKRLFVVLAIYVGLRYVSKGFFGTSWVPPY
ncbi:MAG: sulfite exporter TauE/SafE family protein [Desulfoferrobacter sp.]